MNRNYRVSGYREVVTSIRKILPEATLFTDIIVGFSGETEPQFQKTLAAMEEFRYDMAFIAMYSPRPGAASARWADDIPQDEKKRRLRELTEVLQTTAGARNAAQVGRVVPVLVEGRDRQGYLSGRTEGRVPVRIEEPDDGNDVPPGSFLDVEITSARPLSLYGVPSGAPLLPTAADAPEQTVASVSR
jgi:tRNA-2-methylthio-N6-dimethylallyladenosine synthase